MSILDHVKRPLPVAVVAATLVLSACGSSGNGATSASRTATQRTSTSTSLSGTVNVFAAASLKETFSKLGEEFQAAHPGTRIVFSFGPSSGLATQIGQGAPADVFASASEKDMGQVVSAGGASRPTTFVKNVMEIALPATNPGHVTKLTDLSRPGVKVAVCQPAVPCGVVAAKVFTKAKLDVKPVSQEVDVKSVLTKVMLGEVDAGMVYVTDVKAAGDKVKGIQIPDSVNASTSYPIATLTTSTNKAAAQAFTDFVLSAEGAKVMTAGGFVKP